MSNENLHNLKKSDLLKLIDKQQQEIDKLKSIVKELEKKVKKQEDTIANLSLENEGLKVIELEPTIDNDIIEESSLDVVISKSEKNELMQNITNEEVEIKNEVIDTEEESQIVEVNKSCNMLMVLPTNTDLAIIEPKFIDISKIKIDLKSKVILIIVYVIATITILFSLMYCLKIYKQDDDILELTNNVQSFIVEKEENTLGEQISYFVDFDKLKEINEDTIGWLKVDGLDINMPIVQTDNNNFYLNHSLDKTSNLSGWAFMDFRNKLDGSDKNIVIYGHNRRDNIIFSSLVNILNSDWYNNDDNKNIIFINQNGEIEKYEIFSAYQIEAEDYYINTNFSSDDEFNEFLETLKKRSVKNYNVELNEKSQILTLSTCGRNSQYRVVLHAQKN